MVRGEVADAASAMPYIWEQLDCVPGAIHCISLSLTTGTLHEVKSLTISVFGHRDPSECCPQQSSICTKLHRELLLSNLFVGFSFKVPKQGGEEGR